MSILAGSPAPAEGAEYVITSLGAPEGAGITTAVRMNNLGHVAGYSIFYGQGEPSIRPWVWTPGSGFTILPPPPDMFQGRARAMDISDTGIVAGDGGYDIGIAWRYENGAYETFGTVGGMPIAYLGAVNDAGAVAGTARDATITTEDEIFLDLNDGSDCMLLTPGSAGGRGTDINNAGRLCGYTQGPLSGFEAFIWDSAGGFEFLGTAGLAFSFAADMNDLDQVVGGAQSASGNTVNNWIWSPADGQQILPVPGPGYAAAVNGLGHVVGTKTCCGPDQSWIWSPHRGAEFVTSLADFAGAGFGAPSAADLNDAGQILLNAYDNNAGGFRPILLTPIDDVVGACCLGADTCTAGTTAGDCAAQGGTFLGAGADCAACVPLGACCLGDGDCVPFASAADCIVLVGTWHGGGSSCGTTTCTPGIPNDDCADAAPIGSGDTLFSNVGATTDGPTEATTCTQAFGFGFDIWYAYEPGAEGVLTVSTCNQASFDTQLAAYVGGCGDLVLVGCSDDGAGCAGFTSSMEVPVACGETILIRVGGYSTNTGTGTLSLTLDAATPCGPACAGDTNGDAAVDVTDLVNVVLMWGTTGAAPGMDADVTDDGRVDVADLVTVVLHWGGCGG